MKILNNDHEENKSILEKGRKELATPQGSKLFSAFLICGFLSILLEYIANRLSIPKSLAYSFIIIMNAVIITIYAFRIYNINKKIKEKREEKYIQKYGMKYSDFLSSKGKIIKKKVKSKLSYEDAGVSIDTMEAGLKDALEVIRSTYRAEVLSHQGQFGGLFALDKSKYDEPILVSSTDGVGTKLKIAFMANKHNTIGEDLVAHCGNDIVVLGAEPLFFLDYLGTSKLDRHVMVQILEGLSKGCREIGCALIGGETAEMPSFYHPGEYDLVGTIVGVVERKGIVDGSMIRHGDIIIGLGSSGLHTNGYSLARKILFDVCGYSVTNFIEELNATVCDEFLKPHKSYVKTVLKLINKFNDILPDGKVNFRIKGLAHITGGGLIDNVPRILPQDCNALIKKGSWDILPVFEFLQKKGNVEESEMFRVFNMGIGMVIVVSPKDADFIIDDLRSAGEKAYRIGNIIEGNKRVVFN